LPVDRQKKSACRQAKSVDRQKKFACRQTLPVDRYLPVDRQMTVCNPVLVIK